jgi:hypothetical protein
MGIFTHLFHASSGHTLEASLVGLVNLWDLKLVLSELINQLSCVEFAVTSPSLDNLRLFLQSEVLPCKVWTNVFLEEGENLVMRYGTWVGKIVNAGLFVLSHEDGGWKKIMEDSVGVRDVNNTLVLCNLGNKITRVQVVTDWHAKSKDEAVTIILHDLLMISY